ncbi:MAG: glycosyltransferase family 4 protein [Myxococcales bacterium]|nr:glycosyltransferase family 4 protein [Myxococcales bacterium]
MKVALFAPYLPAPPSTGGRIRIYQLVRHLALECDLHLFATAARRELTPKTQEYLSAFAKLHIFSPGLGLSPWATTPRRVQRSTPRGLARAFAHEHNKTQFDFLWVEHSHAASIAYRFGLPWILNEHNVESQYLRAKFEAHGPMNRSAHQQVLATQRWEATMWQAATEVISVTDADAAHIERIRGSAPIIVPNGVDLTACQFIPPSARSGKTILFVGLMNHPPNEQTALALANEVMPLLWPQHPDARLVLCGANPSRAIKQLANARIEVTGTVPSVYPYLREARIFANLLYHGGGSSLKVLEALASGVPLISTAVGVRGFRLENERHYVEANTPSTMAHQIDRLLSEDTLAETIARAGHQLAQSYSWDELAVRFSKVLSSITS